MGLGPFFVTLLLSLIFGLKLRAGWGMPLLSLWGILLISYLRPAITAAKFHRFVFFIFFTMMLILAGYSVTLKRGDKPSSANFPGYEISQTITQQWHTTYHTKLAYVAGPRWIAGNVSFYSPDRPTVFMGWDTHRTTWINLADMRKKGAVFIWQISEDENLPEEVRQQYPELVNEQVLRFQWHRNKELPVIELGIIFLPPTP